MLLRSFLLSVGTSLKYVNGLYNKVPFSETGYIFSKDMAATFYEESRNLAPLVRHDDIYFGLLASQLKLMPVILVFCTLRNQHFFSNRYLVSTMENICSKGHVSTKMMLLLFVWVDRKKRPDFKVQLNP